MTFRRTAAAAAQWLASAHPAPAQVIAEWSESTDAFPLVPAAVRWDAVVVPHPFAAAVLREMQAARALAGVPVLWDLRAGRSRVYVLVPPGTAVTWHEPPTRAVGVNGWVAMPHPSADHAEDHVLRWEPAPAGPESLADPSALRAAVHRVLRARQLEGGQR